MPRVTIRSGFLTPEGREEELTEYLCDAPDCPNIATHVVACIKELGVSVVTCEEHARTIPTSKFAKDTPRKTP